eukprot:TRINITY_DN5033_c1_g1_i2.p1 TRINITY_DN5033_c1_g1~~TRINITY_DN5033_c1_g1_i2.p1  ORF type:complete len:401 (+),score=152.29 TRINITY_DN5033_c1_g1_i2:936-2138(+)
MQTNSNSEPEVSVESELDVVSSSSVVQHSNTLDIPAPNDCKDGEHCETSVGKARTKELACDEGSHTSKSPGRISTLLSSWGNKRRSSLSVEVEFNGEVIEAGLDSSNSEAAVDEGNRVSRFNTLHKSSSDDEDAQLGSSPVRARMMNKFRSRYNSSSEMRTQQELLDGSVPMSPVAHFRKKSMMESNRKRFSQEDLEEVLKVGDEWYSDGESDDEDQYDDDGQKKPEPIALNAFELVNLLTSLNLSSMAIRGPDAVKRVTCFLSTESPRTILNKISDVLDDLLIQYIARYGLFQVKAVFANSTAETVVFVFQIYEIIDGLYMVEINRRRGPILLFHALYKEIIQALEDLVIKRKVPLNNLKRASISDKSSLSSVTGVLTPETQSVDEEEEEEEEMFVLET